VLHRNCHIQPDQETVARHMENISVPGFFGIDAVGDPLTFRLPGKTGGRSIYRLGMKGLNLSSSRGRGGYSAFYTAESVFYSAFYSTSSHRGSLREAVLRIRPARRNLVTRLATLFFSARHSCSQQIICQSRRVARHMENIIYPGFIRFSGPREKENDDS
jgi:hypothetical protein